jgi:hypothetical protein
VLVWFLLMLYGGKEVYASGGGNVFLHCLGTVVLTALGSGALTGMLWCVYWVLKGIARGWGRILVIPWIGISVWRYPYVLDQSWPDTNPNPVGSAAFFAVFEAAAILLLGIGLCSLLLRALRSAFRSPPPAS